MTALAFRYLIARKRQTVLTLLGIFFGTAAFVCISGLMLGFREYLIDQMVNNSPHVIVRAREDFIEEHALDETLFGHAKPHHVFWDPPPSGTKTSAMIENPQAWFERFRADPRVVAFTPQLTSGVIFSNGKIKASATITGSFPTDQIRVTDIGTYVLEGSFENLSVGGNRVVIGVELQKRLGVRLNQNLLVALGAGMPLPFKVVGVFASGIKQIDDTAYASIQDVQRLNRTPNQVNRIALRVTDPTMAAPMATTWDKLGIERVESWDQLNANLFNVFKMQDAIRYLSIGSVLVVAAFGIYNVLNMTVMQKRKDIAILRSMGYSPRNILSLFFSQGLMLGLSGALTGLIAGYFICLYLSTVPFAGTPIGMGKGTLMISLNPIIYVQAAALGIFSSTLASLLPARAASKMTPIDIIRAGAE